MYIIDELRLNGFQDVCIPSAKDLYSKLGLRDVSRPGSVGKDGEFSEPVNISMSKQDELTRGSIECYRVYSDYQQEESRKASSADNQSDAADAASE